MNVYNILSLFNLQDVSLFKYVLDTYNLLKKKNKAKRILHKNDELIYEIYSLKRSLIDEVEKLVKY